jgi:hypothetical protein
MGDKFKTLAGRLWMFAQIVWRYDMTGFRMPFSVAWEVARIAWE